MRPISTHRAAGWRDLRCAPSERTLAAKYAARPRPNSTPSVPRRRRRHRYLHPAGPARRHGRPCGNGRQARPGGKTHPTTLPGKRTACCCLPLGRSQAGGHPPASLRRDQPPGAGAAGRRGHRPAALCGARYRTFRPQSYFDQHRTRHRPARRGWCVPHPRHPRPGPDDDVHGAGAEVIARKAVLGHEMAVEDMGVAHFQFASGALGVLTTGTCARRHHDRTIEIHGMEGTLSHNEKVLERYVTRGRRSRSGVCARAARRVHQVQIQDLVDAIPKTVTRVDGERPAGPSPSSRPSTTRAAAATRCSPLTCRGDPCGRLRRSLRLCSNDALLNSQLKERDGTTRNQRWTQAVSQGLGGAGLAAGRR